MFYFFIFVEGACELELTNSMFNQEVLLVEFTLNTRNPMMLVFMNPYKPELSGYRFVDALHSPLEDRTNIQTNTF